MAYSVQIEIHDTGAVGSSPVDDAYDALETADNDLQEDYAVSKTGKNELDNSRIESTSNSEREATVEYVEEDLHYDGHLDNDILHLVLYNRTIDVDSGLDGAGFANWNAGESDSSHQGDFEPYREYEGSDGEYALVFVNTATRDFPYNTTIFKNTVAHEVGHALNGYHKDGTIFATTDGEEATPMITWYCEGDCGSEWPDQTPAGEPCYGVTPDACSHRLEYAGCAQDRIDNHIQQYF